MTSQPECRAGEELLHALKSARYTLCSVAVFSAVINLLMLAPALYMLQVYDRVLSSGNAMTLLMLTLLVVGVFVLMGALEWVRGRLAISLGSQWDRQLGTRVYDAAFAASRSRPTNTAQTALEDLTTLRQFATGPALFALLDAPWFIFYLWVIFLLHPWLGWLSLVGAALLMLLAWANQIACRRPLTDAGEHGRRASELSRAQQRNVEVIEAMGMLGAQRQRWLAQYRAFVACQGLASERATLLTALSRGVRLAMQSLVLGLGAWLAVRQEITPGVMIAGSLLMGRVLAPVDQVMGISRQWTSACQAWQRITVLLEAYPIKAVGFFSGKPAGQLAIQQLRICAPGGGRWVVRDVAFDVPAGSLLGVLGQSGSGKSSLLRVLAGAWPAASGSVRLDGKDLAFCDRQALGPYIGYLPQDVQLFAGTIADNITRFAPADTDALLAATRMAGVHALIEQLPQGYDTHLGEAGAGLSGGQRQRIGLARALYGLPVLLVLDEPDANLDEAGERALLDALRQIKALGSTVVVATHKPTLLGLSDYLLILQGGKVQAFGATTDVLATRQRRAMA